MILHLYFMNMKKNKRCVYWGLSVLASMIDFLGPGNSLSAVGELC